jgi:hypothetical protein
MRTYKKTKQLTANISEEHMNKVNDILAHYKNEFPYANVPKYKIIEAIIEDQHKAIFNDK